MNVFRRFIRREQLIRDLRRENKKLFGIIQQQNEVIKTVSKNQLITAMVETAFKFLPK